MDRVWYCRVVDIYWASFWYLFTGLKVSSIYGHIKIVKLFFTVPLSCENKLPGKCL